MILWKLPNEVKQAVVPNTAIEPLSSRAKPTAVALCGGVVIVGDTEKEEVTIIEYPTPRGPCFGAKLASVDKKKTSWKSLSSWYDSERRN